MANPNPNGKSKPGGRIIWPKLESIPQCAGMLGCSESLLKAAKRAGCKAFISGGRIDTEILLPFLFSVNTKAVKLPDGFASWREVGEMNTAGILEVKRKAAQKLVMETSEVKRQVSEGVGMMFAELDRNDREQPPALAGRSAVEISERMQAGTKAIKKNLEVKFQEIWK
jgi:hypothetical protein